MFTFKKLEIRGYGKHKGTVIHPNKLNIIFGRNMDGKSTIRDAIFHLITGASLRKNFINRESKKCVLFGDFGAMKIQRSNTPSSMGIGNIALFKEDGAQQLHQEKTNKDKQAEIYKFFGLGEVQIGLLLYSTNFLTQSPDKQLDFITQLLDIKVTTPSISECLAKDNQKKFMKIIGDTVGGPELIQTCYDILFEKRKESKRRLRTLGVDMDRGFVSVLPEGAELKHKEAATKLLTDLDVARNRLYEKRGALGNFDLDQVERRLAAIEVNLKSNEKFLAEDLQNQLVEIEGVIAEIKPEEEALQKKIQDHRDKLAVENATIKQLQDQLADAAMITDKCPTCGSEVDKLEMEKHIAQELQTHTKIAEKISGTGKKLKETSRAEELAGAISGKARIEQKIKNRKAIEVQCRRDRGEKDRLLAEKEKAGDKTADIAQVDKHLAEVEARIDKGRDVVKKMEEEQTNIAQWKKTEDAFVVSKKEVDELEIMVKDFDIERIKNALFNKQLLEFRHEIQKNLEDFSDLKIIFNFEKDFEILVDGDVSSDMSRSQRLRGGIAIQCALCYYMDFPLLVIDDLDVFDYASIPRVSEFLIRMAKKMEAILAFCTMKTDKIPVAPKSMPWYTVLKISDGNLEEATE